MIRCPKRTWKLLELIGSSEVTAGFPTMRVQFTSHRWANSIQILSSVLPIQEPPMVFSDCWPHYTKHSISYWAWWPLIFLSNHKTGIIYINNSPGCRPIAVSVQIHFLKSDFIRRDWTKPAIIFGLNSITFDVTVVPRLLFLNILILFLHSFI